MKFTKFIFSLFLFILLSSKCEDCVSLIKLENNTCGELCLSKYIASFAIKFGGVQEGNCKDKGYTIFDHKETISVGPFGNYYVDIYKKTASILNFLDEDTSSNTSEISTLELS